VKHFGVTASGVLEVLPKLAIAIVTLAQAREATYLSAFDAAWQRRGIVPVAGAIIEWP
jgi:hypothetical protein